MARVSRFVSGDSIRCLAAAAVALLCVSTSAAIEPPQVLDSAWKIELIASEPQLVTPTGCCFDDQGRLLVIECHTHFPPEGYAGPKTDRVYLFDDSDGNGVLDRKRVFFEGGVASMNIVNIGDGWIALATRSEVVRMRDSDGDGVVDERVVVLTHKTKANYPHNGLGGLTYGPDGWLYVGQGENFGEPYELIGTDGSKQIGGGEGGNVFRCRPDGTHVERVATGFWNPFGMCFDHAQRLWVVGNDPDAMPPNRLLHVVPGGDFGFQFRFGRAGIHPLLAWNGEYPGTLPMVTGTGEAACSVVTHGQHLWATSWGDNRVERYTVVPRGASWSSKTEVVVQGDASFRPVGLAVAGDGSIYVTDWVDRSYPVHGKGRLWRISRKDHAPQPHTTLPELTDAERVSARLRSGRNVAASVRVKALEASDPFVRQAAMTGLIDSNQLSGVDVASVKSPSQLVGLLTAWRWKELCDPESLNADQRRQLLQTGLQNESSDVVLGALRWATERRCKELLPAIHALLERDEVSPDVFAAVIASVAYLETGSASGRKRDPAIEKLLIEFSRDSNRAAALRGLAVRQLPVDAETPTDEELGRLVMTERARAFASEVVRLLISRSGDSAFKQLAAIAIDKSFDDQSRADALAGLASQAGQYAELIDGLAGQSQSKILQTEAQRVRHHSSNPESSAGIRPARENIAAWTELVGDGGNIEAGRRVFFRRQCAACHTHSGRGAKTGPDLSTLAGTMTRQRVIESILQPSKEVGPLYVPWMVLTVDGRSLTGLKLDKAGVGGSVQFQGADGKFFDVPLSEIDEQRPIEQSIMPNGLENSMTIEELRDLVAFLTSP